MPAFTYRHPDFNLRYCSGEIRRKPGIRSAESGKDGRDSGWLSPGFAASPKTGNKKPAYAGFLANQIIRDYLDAGVAVAEAAGAAPEAAAASDAAAGAGAAAGASAGADAGAGATAEAAGADAASSFLPQAASAIANMETSKEIFSCLYFLKIYQKKIKIMR
jgi:hypothetical protein